MQRTSDVARRTFVIALLVASAALGKAQLLTFESASIEPAPAEARTSGTGFMIGLGKEPTPHGLLSMTAPLPVFIMFAYSVEDEAEARAMRSRLPDWAQTQKYTIAARPPQDAATRDEVRQMLRSLLEDRFQMKAHRASHTGTVNLLIQAKPGITGPGLTPHDPAQACLQRGTKYDSTEPGKPTPPLCGLDLRQDADTLFHVRMVNVTVAEACTLFGGLGGVLGGRSMDQVIDNTGLQGRWDIAMDFVPERAASGGDAPAPADISGDTFTGALEKQLGFRLKKGTGPVEDLIVDHIARPTAD